MSTQEPQRRQPGEASQTSRVDMADIFSRREYDQLAPPRRRFEAWHRPRKQVVRQIQWGSEIQALLAKKPAGDKSFRYLGLPGPDLLDLRYFYRRFCEQGDHALTFLGFDDAARSGASYRTALNVSLNEVRRLKYVDKASDILGDDFRLLADRSSIAWSLAEGLGPFDVINVDLCGYMAEDDPQIDLSYYNAIYQLCSLQQRYPSSWSLFITSRMDQGHMADDALEKLLRVLQNNLGDCPDFAAAFTDCFGTLDYGVEQAKRWEGGTFYGSMCVALAKWLLSLAYSMRNSFSLSSVAGYRVRPGAPYLDMVSLVLRFEPLVALGIDRAGLASGALPLVDECVQATPIPKKVTEVVDIDRALYSNMQIWTKFRDATGELLEMARYSAESYRNWADRDLARVLRAPSPSDDAAIGGPDAGPVV